MWRLMIICSTILPYSVLSVLVNVAKYKVARQSGVADGGSAMRAVDGNNATAFSRGSCTQTPMRSNQFWFVDLGRSDYVVVAAKITNRADSLGYHLHDYATSVGKYREKPQKETVCFFREGVVGDGKSELHWCYIPVEGKYFFIRILSTSYSEILSLCEVEVFIEVRNAAGGRVTTQYPTSNSHSRYAVDNYLSSVSDHVHPCAQTSTLSYGSSSYHWWEVKLDDVHIIYGVLIVSSKEKRLTKFQVMVGNHSHADNREETSCFQWSGRIREGWTVYRSCTLTLYGKYVIIKNRVPGTLVLCEVMVHARKLRGKCTVKQDSDALFWDASELFPNGGFKKLENKFTDVQLGVIIDFTCKIGFSWLDHGFGGVFTKKQTCWEDGEVLTQPACQGCMQSYAGTKYRGTRSFTSRGVCLPWQNSRQYGMRLYHEKNYCRNPDNSKHGPWCYLKSQADTKVVCTNIPMCKGYMFPNLNCKLKNNGASYRGYLKYTRDNSRCNRWADGGEYCRNPTGDPKGPYCYVDPSRSKKDYCNVMQCSHLLKGYETLIKLGRGGMAVNIDSEKSIESVGATLQVFLFSCVQFSPIVLIVIQNGWVVTRDT